MVSVTETSTASEETVAGTARFPQLPSVPRARYLDFDFYRLEIEHIFKKKWLLVGHTSEYIQAGSYRLLDVPFAPVVVLRDKEGALRAFLNSCQHRGATVLREKQGCAKFLSCQYHGWTYDLTGQLVSVTSPQNFPGLKVGEHSLVRLRCELWGELVFINFDPHAEPLMDYLAPCVKRFQDIPELSTRIGGQLTFEVACNWKAMVDAFYESYHLPYIHGTSIGGLIEADQIIYELYSNGHGCKVTPYARDVKKDKMSVVASNVLPRLRDRNGRPVFDDSSHSAVCMFPNVDLVLQPRGGIGLLNIWPIGIDRCRLDYTFLCEDWGSGPKPDYFGAFFIEVKKLLDEDMANMCSIQHSLKADPEKGVVLGSEEVLLYNFHAEIDRLIGSENIPESLRVPDALREFVI